MFGQKRLIYIAAIFVNIYSEFPHCCRQLCMHTASFKKDTLLKIEIYTAIVGQCNEKKNNFFLTNRTGSHDVANSRGPLK